MPDFVTNRIKLYGDQKKIDEVLAFLEGDNGAIDFNNIVEMPLELRTTESGSRPNEAWDYYETKVLGNTYPIEKRLEWEWVEKAGIRTVSELLKYMEDESPDILNYGKSLHELQSKYGYHDWYNWAIDNWESKWNAVYPKREGNTILFLTPYTPIWNLMLKVSERFADVTINYEFADGAIGWIVGKSTFLAGEVISATLPEGNSEEAIALAVEILGIEDLASYSFGDLLNRWDDTCI